MKRHPAFQDLSRDHYAGLIACLQVARAAEGHPRAQPAAQAVGHLWRLWHADIRHHFDEEETNLEPVLVAEGAPGLVEKLRSDHAEIRAMIERLSPTDAPGDWAPVAERLRAHIRWEEEELFEWMQAHLSSESLDALLAASVAFRTEVRGPGSVRTPVG